MPQSSFERHVAEWKKLLAAAEIHEVEVPQLGPFKAALEEELERKNGSPGYH
jgi:hypothetical protein